MTIHFQGWCHEYMVIPDGIPVLVLNDVCIRHNSTPHASSGEDSNARNLRILNAQWQHQPDARTAFYLANTHKDACRWQDAVEWYYKRLGFGDTFRDEWLFALLYLARSLRQYGAIDVAVSALDFGMAIEPGWMEYRMERAFIAYQRKDYATSIAHAQKAFNQPWTETPLWRERSMYRDQPARLISWCHEHLGNFAQALTWAEEAQRMIQGEDPEWTLRTNRLRALNRPKEANAVRRIALHRPGAIGDVLLTLNLIPALRDKYPDARIAYFAHSSLVDPEGLGTLMLAAGVDLPMDCKHMQPWRADFDRVIDLVGYPLHEGYPERPMRRHLLEYFAEELDLQPVVVPTIELPKPKHALDLPPEYAALQVHAGWSRYKEWPLRRWRELLTRPELPPFVQIGEAHQELVVGAIDARGLTLHQSLGVIAGATLHVGIDSFGNHATNFFWRSGNHARRVPGVILWGSTQWEAAGYRENTNIGYRPTCGPCFREDPKISRMPRGPCVSLTPDGVHRCMDLITVDEVAEAVRTLWQRETRLLGAAA